MIDSMSSPGAHRAFSQRFGYEPVPTPMRLEEVSRDLRREVWNTIRELLIKVSGQHSRNYYFSGDSRLFVQRALGAYRRVPEDDVHFPGEGTRDVDDGFGVAMASLFDRHAAAYWLDVNARPYRFFPRSNKAQGEAVREAIDTVRRAGMDGADTHLGHAAEHIRAGRHAEAVKDSILAVESVARSIDPKDGRTLGPALRSLEERGVVQHQALKEAFLALYGYANDEQGIRHALLKKTEPAVGIDESMFMFGACASFAAYLTNKHRKLAGRKQDAE